MTILTEYESKKLLSKYGIPVTKEFIAKNTKEAIQFAEQIGFPVAMKIVSKEITHKSDSGCVLLNIDLDEVEEGFNTIINNANKHVPYPTIDGVLISEMVQSGIETIVGVKRDPQFGAVIMFGLGGIFVEVFKDVSLRVAPITKFDAINMIKEIKGYKILKGFRGCKEYDIDSVVDVLLSVSKISEEINNLLELDINPLIVQEKGVVAVDARILLKPRHQEAL
ncbi:MAG TPA: acetyl-CoA synthetase [Methanosarcinales archaeon]|nr:acetyl-CoA synthetase [Methanosarcinales archaeon]